MHNKQSAAQYMHPCSAPKANMLMKRQFKVDKQGSDAMRRLHLHRDLFQARRS